jgi:hypothetical protein
MACMKLLYYLFCDVHVYLVSDLVMAMIYYLSQIHVTLITHVEGTPQNFAILYG